MRYFPSKGILIACMLWAASQGAVRAQNQPQAQSRQAPAISGVGAAPTQEDLGNLAWVSGPSGKALPQGSGTAKKGADIFLAKCSMCHGANAQGIHWQPGELSPVGGLPLAKPGGTAEPNKEPHSPWAPPITSGAPFPEVIFNTVAVEMPMLRPGTLKADEVYSLVAFIFFKNGLIKEDDEMNRDTLPRVQMPNRSFFPASDDIYMDMKKRGCYRTSGVCLGD